MARTGRPPLAATHLRTASAGGPGTSCAAAAHANRWTTTRSLRAWCRSGGKRKETQKETAFIEKFMKETEKRRRGRRVR